MTDPDAALVAAFTEVLEPLREAMPRRRRKLIDVLAHQLADIARSHRPAPVREVVMISPPGAAVLPPSETHAASIMVTVGAGGCGGGGGGVSYNGELRHARQTKHILRP